MWKWTDTANGNPKYVTPKEFPIYNQLILTFYDLQRKARTMDPARNKASYSVVCDW